MLEFTLNLTIQLIAYIALAPAVLGVLRWGRARLQGRQAGRIYQPYLDFFKLWRRQPVVPETASWLFLAAPGIVFLCYAFLGLLMPITYLPTGAETHPLLYSPVTNDLVIILYILGLARFTLALAGIDAGSPFGGLGSSREMFLHVLNEPALILSVYALSLLTLTASLPKIIQALRSQEISKFYSSPVIWLIFFALVLVLLAEAGRLPVDNPASHLELGMVGKALHLEYSGQLLALLEYADALRLTFFLTLVLNLFCPWLMATSSQAGWQNLLLSLSYPFKLGALAFLLALWETLNGKLRLRLVIRPAGLALALSILAVVFVVVVE